MKKFSNIFLRLAAGLGQRLKRLSALIFALFFIHNSFAHTSTATVFTGYDFSSVWFANKADMSEIFTSLLLVSVAAFGGAFLIRLILSMRF